MIFQLLLLTIVDLDWILFHWINVTLESQAMNVLLPWLREAWIWLPLYVFIIAYMFVNWKSKAWMIVFFFLFTAAASDFISSSVIKPLVSRERPCNDLQRSDQVSLKVHCGAGYSFPSSHASNHSAMAVFLFLFFAKAFSKSRYIFLLWAFLVSFAQVYVGVHYPSDIIGGWILGIILGIFIFRLMNFYFMYFYKVPLHSEYP